ncbi:hypothetical protein J7E93_22735 [Streptomyces sp. ISL-36]|uniref:hypothetical protein n=1 Tax=Streptomyces sp. ISL-36 TaxID=2819182 RepID=UPI001BE824CD|nr:hypothetical protein [Streptomyces sp. ISL-36]MBT2442870.1 hypothetical protein [Streptomyces sp. ISL-36]
MDLNPRGLPELEEWVVESDDFHLQGFMSANVSVAQAVALAALFRPGFVEFAGGVFLGFRFGRDGVDVWIEHLSGDLRAVESVVNRIHLWDYFTPTSDAEYAALPALAEEVAAMWRGAAREAFPGRGFEVSVTGEPDAYGPTLTLVTLDDRDGR